MQYNLNCVATYETYEPQNILLKPQNILLRLKTENTGCRISMLGIDLPLSYNCKKNHDIIMIVRTLTLFINEYSLYFLPPGYP